MQIGIDLGASKIESVVLDEQGNEQHRQRVDCPKNYNSIIEEIKKIVLDIENKIQKTLPLGVCHPGVHSPQSGHFVENVLQDDKHLMVMFFVFYFQYLKQFFLFLQ